MCDSRYSNMFAQTCYTLVFNPSIEIPTLTYAVCFFSSLLCGFRFLVLELVLLLLLWQWSLYEEKPFQPMHIMVSIHISIVWHFNMVLRMKMINIDGASFSSIHSLFTVWLLLLLLDVLFAAALFFFYTLSEWRMAIIL